LLLLRRKLWLCRLLVNIQVAVIGCIPLVLLLGLDLLLDELNQKGGK